MITLDRAVSQGLGGQPIDASLYELRREHEARLIECKSDLKAACCKADQLRKECNAQEVMELDISPEIEAQLAESQSVLLGKAQVCERAEQILEAFRLRHGLTRGPSTTQPAISSLVVSLLVFGESAINAAFFSNAHMVAGPFAALQTSFLISLTNVSVSALGGYFIGRWMDYGINAEDSNDPALKLPRLFARIGLIPFVGLLSLFHMTIGLVRATESLDFVVHDLENYINVITTPEALFLVMTGSCLSIMAYRKGKLAFDDPYPGYGQRHRELEMLRDEVVDAYEDFRERIEERFEELLREDSRVMKSHLKSLASYNVAAKECHTQARKLEQAVEDAESIMRKQVAKLVSHFSQGSRGRKSAVKEQELNRLLSFDKYLPGAIPKLMQGTAAKARHERYASQKSEALAKLTQHYQSLLKIDEENL